MQAGFRQRRKQLHNALARELPVGREELGRAFAACGIDPERRAQTLSRRRVAVPPGAAGAGAGGCAVMPLRLDAPAKLNLSLTVVGPAG